MVFPAQQHPERRQQDCLGSVTSADDFMALQNAAILYGGVAARPETAGLLLLP
jgi:hypothetical protein